MFEIQKTPPRMTAKDIISPIHHGETSRNNIAIPANTHIIDVLHTMTSRHCSSLNVMDDDDFIGVVDTYSLLQGLERLIIPRDDSSIVVIECSPKDYSASHIAHAVEDADAHLVDLLSAPTDSGKLQVTLRVRHIDPSAVIKSLERYGYDVVDIHTKSSISDYTIAAERLQALQMILNI